MDHPRTTEWQKKLKTLFDEVDDYLEDKYGHLYTLHPSRAQRGKTSSKSHDGLFNVGARFSPGYGSTKGRGYVIDVDMVTLERVPPDMQKKIERDVVDYVSKKLPSVFPDRDLKVASDGRVFKIYGDLSLGQV